MAKKKKKPQTIKEEPKQPDKSGDVAFQMISLDLVDDPEQPMRSDLTEASVEDLVMSIKQVGIIEPIIVKEVKGRYEVIAGHRRTFAARLAKLVEVPCYVRKANDEETEMLKIHENLYRADIKPADEAIHFARLIDKQNITPARIAQLISKSPSYVSDRLAILNYPDFLKEALDKGQISFSVAREFARFDDIQQMRQAVYYAKRGGMTQEMARKWVLDHKRAKHESGVQEVKPPAGTSPEAPIEHSARCIFCGEGLRLIEAQVVYMHDHCHREALELQSSSRKNQAQPEEPPEPAAD